MIYDFSNWSSYSIYGSLSYNFFVNLIYGSWSWSSSVKSLWMTAARNFAQRIERCFPKKRNFVMTHLCWKAMNSLKKYSSWRMMSFAKKHWRNSEKIVAKRNYFLARRGLLNLHGQDVLAMHLVR